MSLPATEFWFSNSVRRNRKSYILANIMLLVLIVIVISALKFFDASQRVGSLIFIVFFVPFSICQYFLAGQRLRDFGVTGWLALIWVPIASLPEPFYSAVSMAAIIVLCSIPGTKGPNRYGGDPLESW